MLLLWLTKLTPHLIALQHSLVRQATISQQISVELVKPMERTVTQILFAHVSQE